jgi:anthranilate synthase component 1
MIVPSREEFRALAQSGKLVPVYREVFADFDTPVSAFRKIDDGPYAFLLESVEGGEKWGRYSLLGSRPSLVFIARGDTCEIHQDGRVTKGTKPPLEELAELLRRHQAVALPGLPRFCGGAVGYLGYDTVRWFERLPHGAREEMGLPDAVFLFGDVVSVFDNLTHTLKVVTHARGGADPDAAYAAAAARIEAEVARLRRAMPWEDAAAGPALAEPVSSATREQYVAAVETAKEHIRAGDIFQVVLGAMSAAVAPDSRAYCAARRPRPISTSSSSGTSRSSARRPRCWCSRTDGVVEVRPIAGTRPAGAGGGASPSAVWRRREGAPSTRCSWTSPQRRRRVAEYGTVETNDTCSSSATAGDAPGVERARPCAGGPEPADVVRACLAGTASGRRRRAMEIDALGLWAGQAPWDLRLS